MKTFCLRRDKKSTGTWRAFRFSAFPPTRLLTRRCGRCQIAHRSLGEQFSLTLFLWTYEILQPRDIAALWKASVRHLLRIRRVGRTFNGRSCYAFCCLLIKYLLHCIYISCVGICFYVLTARPPINDKWKWNRKCSWSRKKKTKQKRKAAHK